MTGSLIEIEIDKLLVVFDQTVSSTSHYMCAAYNKGRSCTERSSIRYSCHEQIGPNVVRRVYLMNCRLSSEQDGGQLFSIQSGAAWKKDVET